MASPKRRTPGERPHGDRRAEHQSAAFLQCDRTLERRQHGKMKVRPVEKSPQIGQTHAIPVTVDEFGLAQRHFPIVFSVGDIPIPIGLMGLNEGVNVFLDADGGRPIRACTCRPTSAAIRSCSRG